jgi:hypothetical protein
MRRVVDTKGSIPYFVRQFRIRGEVVACDAFLQSGGKAAIDRSRNPDTSEAAYKPFL